MAINRLVRDRRTLLVAALLSIVAAAICQPARPAAMSPIVSVANAMVKVKPTDVAVYGSAAEIHAAQNEFEAFQLVITGPATGVTVRPPDLTGPSGSKIPAGDVRLYREGYQNITTPSNTEGGTGRWPDALIPDIDETANEKRNAFPFDIPSGENRVVWVEVHVPETQDPGTYLGSVIVESAGNSPVSVPMTLLVWNFLLPSTSSLSSTFGMGWSSTCVAHFGSYEACGYDTGVEKMHVLYSRFMLDHRITSDVVYYGPGGCTGLNCNWTNFDATYGALFDGTDPNLRLKGAKQTTIRYVWQRGSSSYYAGWAAHFRQKGWFDRTYDYTCDEPPAGCAWSSINTQSTLIHSGDPEFRTLVTTDIKNATANGVVNSINILSPVVNYMHDKPNVGSLYQGNQRPAYDSFLQAYNNQLWWYQSCMSHGCGGIGGDYFSGWPSFMVDNTAVQNRSQGVLSWTYKIGGVLYFQIDYKLAGAWDSVYAFGGNGDGTLLYPGKPSIIGGTTHIPVASIRLKMIREGLEDYEYLKLVSDLGDPAFAQQTGVALFPAPYNSRQTPEAVYAAREALAKRILELKGVRPPGGGGSDGGGVNVGLPYRVEETNAVIGWNGQWRSTKNATLSGGTAKSSQDSAARTSFTFTGTSIAWIGTRDDSSGKARVTVIDSSQRIVDQQITDAYSAATQSQKILYSKSNLPWGTYTITIEVLGQKGTGSKGKWVWIDAFDYVGASL